MKLLLNYGSNENQIDNINISQPVEFTLSQNYPNPFNPTTVIHYSLSENGFIILKVFDLLGKEIVTLINQNQIAGRYSVDFNGSNLASGIYFYKLETQGTNGQKFVSTKRMVLVK